MIIIYEGIDCTGKTSAAIELSKVLDATYIHVSGGDANTKEFYEQLFEECPTDNLVLDRGVVGELVYGPQYRQNSRISIIEMIDILKTYRVQLIYRRVKDWNNYTAMKVLRDGYDELKLDEMTKDHAEFDKYISLLRGAGCNVQIHDIDFKFNVKFEVNLAK